MASNQSSSSTSRRRDLPEDFKASEVCKLVPTLTRENAERWFKSLKMALVGHRAWFVIERPEDATEEAKCLVCSILERLTTEPALFDLHDGDPRAIWQALERRYLKTQPKDVDTIRAEFSTYKKKSNETVQQAHDHLRSLARKLNQLEQSDHYNEIRVFKRLLHALPKEYSTVRDILLSKEIDESNLDLCITRVLNKESELNGELDEDAHYGNDRSRGGRKPGRSSGKGDLRNQGRRRRKYSDHQIPPRGNRNGTEKKPNQNQKSTGSDGSMKGRCFVCNKRGHRASDCEELEKARRILESISTEKKDRNRDDERGHWSKADERVESLHERSLAEEALMAQGPSPQGCTTKHSAEPSANPASEESDEDEKAPDQLPRVDRHEWILDTGASAHMTWDKRMFSSFKPIVTTRKVQTGGARLAIEGIGTVRIADTANNTIRFKNVLYVPDLGVNLISVGTLCDKGVRFSMPNASSDIHFYHDGKLIFRATRAGRFWCLNRFSRRAGEMALRATASSYADDSSDELALVSEVDVGEKRESSYRLWHRRIGHLGVGKVRSLYDVADGLEQRIVPGSGEALCDVCLETKMRREKRGRCAPRSELLELVGMDICGPFPPSLTRNKYFIQIVDYSSRKGWVLPIPDRKVDTVRPILDRWKLSAELESGKRLLAVRTDNAPELINIVDSWNKSHGVRHERTIPHSSWQNGVAERAIETSEDGMRALLKDSGLPDVFWDEAVRANMYVRNRVQAPRGATHSVTPEEAWSGKRPSIEHLRVWGCKTHSYVDPKSVPGSTKLSNRGRVGVFVGYEENTTKQFRIYAPDVGHVIRASIVKFDESVRGGDMELNLPVATRSADPIKEKRSKGRSEIRFIEYKGPEGSKSTAPRPENKAQGQTETREMESSKVPTDNSKETKELGAQTEEGLQAPERRGTKREREEDALIDDRETKRLELAHFLEHLHQVFTASLETTWTAETRTVPIPKTYEEAVNHPKWGPYWRKAVHEELRQLIRNKTFRNVKRSERMNLVTSKWVFAVKHRADGSIDRFKARLVARGFTQRHGIDFHETFAPTMRADALRILLAIIALEDLEAHQIDVNNAFTEAKLKETIYMEPPPGMDVPNGHVLQVCQSLYGLKQAARDWYDLCSSALREMGFEPLVSEPCVFRNKKTGVLVGLYVDDMVIAARTVQEVQRFKTEFGKRFKIKDLGELSRVLGIQIKRDRTARTMHLDQSAHIEKLLREYGMATKGKGSASVPLNTQVDLWKMAGEKELASKGRQIYQRQIGSVMYLMVYTRPDIAFATSRLAQFMTCPTKRHSGAMKTLLKYLRTTQDLKIKYSPHGQSATRCIGFTDSDFAGDKSDRKSTSGMVFMLGGGPVAWRSRKQTAVATSTTEAEYVAAAMAAKHAKWISQFLKDLGYSRYVDGADGTAPIRLCLDNKGALDLVKQPQINDRSKHIDVAFHFIKDLWVRKVIDCVYIPTREMVADALTKPLSKARFTELRVKMGLNARGSDI